MSTVITIRVDGPDLEKIDAARGDLSRSDWIRTAIADALTGGKGARVPSQRLPVAAPWKKDCKHPANRRLGGFCAACGRQISG